MSKVIVLNKNDLSFSEGELVISLIIKNKVHGLTLSDQGGYDMWTTGFLSSCGYGVDGEISHNVAENQKSTKGYYKRRTPRGSWEKLCCLWFRKALLSKKDIGYLYVIKCNEIYKLGFTRNADTRFAKYKTECPYPFEVIVRFKTIGVTELEYLLKKYFKPKRVRGEWFMLTEHDICVIRRFEDFFCCF